MAAAWCAVALACGTHSPPTGAAPAVADASKAPPAPDSGAETATAEALAELGAATDLGMPDLTGAADLDGEISAVAGAELDAAAEAVNDAPTLDDTEVLAAADAEVAAQPGADGTVDATADVPDSLDGGAAEVLPADVSAPADAAPVPIGPIDPAALPFAEFANVTAEFGIDPDKPHGVCVAAADLDGNGREDLLVIERTGTKAKIHAVLLGPAAPAHVWTEFDTTLLLPTTGCVLVDMDDDSKPDLLVGGPSGAAFYHGDGKGGFVDASADWLPYVMDFTAWAIAPVDLDGDGDLDLFVGAGSPAFDTSNPGPGPACGSSKCGYEGDDFVCALVTKEPNIADLQDRVLMRGPKLPLVDQTKAWNVPPAGILSAPLPLDVDKDGKMDVFLANDFGEHYLLRNAGGAFERYDIDIGFYPYAHGMGWGLGDFNGDGLADLVLPDVGPNPVFMQVKPGPMLPVAFVDKGGEMGVWGPTWSASTWSPMVADFDHDGLEDMLVGSALNTSPKDLPAVTAGCTKNGVLPFGGHPNIDLLFTASPGGGFTAKRFASGPESHFMAIAQAVVDLDADGDLDVLQSRPGFNLTSRIRVWRNDLPKKGASCRVVVQGKAGNRDAVGAIVTAQIGGKLRTRWLTGGGGFGSTRIRIAEFGLGGAPKASNVVVTWPNGAKTAVGDVAAGATQVVVWK
ncbi:MAG: CRTAC1 family protein [Deltaproteobacteria bacterium]|nr:CRTAC1 family protein [Deltaproteobacteria bacterium]